ncbi:hypothetical protein ACHAQA_007688 [Verticillium albo-atrum]
MKYALYLLSCLLGVTWAQSSICDAECQINCDAVCQAAIDSTYAAESRLWLTPDINTDPFYSTPTNISCARPGDILRWENVLGRQLSSNWTIPASLTLARFMYATEDINNRTIPATAWILLPYSSSLETPREVGKLRTVVWAHGTAGYSRLCSTINHRGLFYEWKAPFFLAEMGYAVIAPDYAGQGSNISAGFAYEAGFLHATDVAYSVIAAKKALGHVLSNKWAVYGHSEGGLTAWRTAERLALPGEERLLKAGEFIGAVAAAPALRPQRLFPLTWEATGTGGGPFSIYWLQSIAALYPDQIRVEDYLTDTALQRLNILDNSCLLTGMATVGTLTVEETFKNTSWITHPATNDWATRYNGQGPHRLAAPLLIIQGTTDFLVPAVTVVEDFNLTCTTYPDSPAQYKTYPNMGHGEVLESGRADVLDWLDARFNEIPVEQGCVSEEVQPLTQLHSQVDLFWQASNVQFN